MEMVWRVLPVYGRQHAFGLYDGKDDHALVCYNMMDYGIDYLSAMAYDYTVESDLGDDYFVLKEGAESIDNAFDKCETALRELFSKRGIELTFVRPKKESDE